MTVVAIIQARLGSSRLPAKVIADLCGDTMLARVVGRVRAARSIDRVMIATTTSELDDTIVSEANRLGASVYRGSEHDVLDRYLGAAKSAGAGIVVRITADCPLIDPAVIDAVVAAVRTAPCDYASNTHQRSYPRGLDVEALPAASLAMIAANATSAAAREHVTAFVMEQPERFAIRQVVAPRDDSDLRWTVDTHEDLALVRQLYSDLGLAHVIRPYAEVVAWMRAHPELIAINAHVEQKSWRGDDRVN